MENKERVKRLLEKLRMGTITWEEIEWLSEYLGQPGTESEIKGIMDDHWREIERREDGNFPDMEENNSNGFSLS